MSGGACRYPLVITTGIGGGYNDAAQHSQCLYSIFAHVPGLKVVVPSNAFDAKGLMTTAIRDDNPVVFLYHKGIMGLSWMSYFEGSTNEVPEEQYTIPFGEARVVREGRDLSIVTLSQMVQKSVLAAEKLAEEGISAEIRCAASRCPTCRFPSAARSNSSPSPRWTASSPPLATSLASSSINPEPGDRHDRHHPRRRGVGRRR
jgi:pyruvate/2-oxoglutarate/acetoin dehydrogenase E1 component